TVTCSTPRDTPEYASITLRLVYLPSPKPSCSDPSRAAAIAHTFSVHDGSVVPTVAKVSTTWWVNCSSAGSRGPTGLATIHVLREVGLRAGRGHHCRWRRGRGVHRSPSSRACPRGRGDRA